ncbi:DUF5360 family protein [Nannocystaceae bacterium ST9]
MRTSRSIGAGELGHPALGIKLGALGEADSSRDILPLDLLASFTGLGSLALARRGDPRWPLPTFASLAFTSAAGLNAIAFWALRGDFDPTWWGPNLLLAVGPWPLAWRIWRNSSDLTISQK